MSKVHVLPESVFRPTATGKEERTAVKQSTEGEVLSVVKLEPLLLSHPSLSLSDSGEVFGRSRGAAAGSS